MGRSRLGVDLGSRFVKVLQMEEESGSRRITGFAIRELTAGDSPVDALRTCARGASWRTNRAVLGVSGRSVFVRFVQMAAMSDEELANAARYELGKYIPIEVDEVFHDCQRLGELQEGAKEMRVVLAAARRAFLDERIGMIETAELVPHAVDVEALALANAYEFATQVNTDLPGRGRAVGIVEFGASKTTVVVLDDLVCVFAREFYRGGDDLTEAIARKLGVDAAQAEALKREPAERTHEIAGALEDVLEEICQDVKISLDFFENQNDRQADVVLLTGGSCGVAGMRDAMERMLGRPVDVWNPLDGIPVQMNAESEATMRAHAWQCGVALGLALRFDP